MFSQTLPLAALGADCAHGIVAEGVAVDVVVDAVALAVAADPDAGAAIAVHEVVAEDVAAAARAEAARVLVELARAAVVLDDVLRRRLLDVDAFVAARVKVVVMDPVAVGLVGRRVRRAATAELLRRRADIDRLAVLSAPAELEVVHAAALEDGMRDLVFLGEVAQADAFAAAVAKGHADHLKALEPSRGRVPIT